MNGLQHNLKSRSKNWTGYTTYRFNEKIFKDKEKEVLKSKLSYSYSLEKNLEGVIDNRGVVVPVFVRAIVRTNHQTIKHISSGVSLSHDLTVQAGLTVGDKVSLIIPHVVDEFFGDRPRTKSLFVTDNYSSYVGEVDKSNLFIDFKYLADLTRNLNYNVLRVYEEHDPKTIIKLLESVGAENIRSKTWESENSSLVHALFLEKTMMIFLFSSLALLISQAITGGFLLIFHRLKFDYASLWLLGVSKRNIFRSNLFLISSLILTLCFFGVSFGYLFTFLLKYFGRDIMPFVFVERNIPIYITESVFLVSFFIPLVISILFACLALLRTTSKQNHLETIRAIS